MGLAAGICVPWSLPVFCGCFGVLCELVRLCVADLANWILLSALCVASKSRYAGYLPWNVKEDTRHIRIVVPPIRHLAIWRAVFLPQTAVMAFGLGRNTLCGKAVRHGRASVLALYYSCTAASA